MDFPKFFKFFADHVYYAKYPVKFCSTIASCSVIKWLRIFKTKLVLFVTTVTITYLWYVSSADHWQVVAMIKPVTFWDFSSLRYASNFAQTTFCPGTFCLGPFCPCSFFCRDSLSGAVDDNFVLKVQTRPTLCVDSCITHLPVESSHFHRHISCAKA